MMIYLGIRGNFLFVQCQCLDPNFYRKAKGDLLDLRILLKHIYNREESGRDILMKRELPFLSKKAPGTRSIFISS
jgi:hypothetical protein